MIFQHFITPVQYDEHDYNDALVRSNDMVLSWIGSNKLSSMVDELPNTRKSYNIDVWKNNIIVIIWC